MTSNNGRMRTRIITYEEMVRIDTMVVSDHELKADVPIATRKWKGKWFSISTAFIPNPFIEAILRRMSHDKKFSADIADFIKTIVKQDEEKTQKGE
jgi:hypothetical protein